MAALPLGLLVLLACGARAQTAPSALGRLGELSGQEAPKALPKPAAKGPLDLTPREAEDLGRLVWRNEGGNTIESLTFWSPREDFPSMGIGHFIWYPAGVKPGFIEDFPKVVRFLEANKVSMPSWISGGKPCPWKTRRAFEAARQGKALSGLRAILARTVALQALYIAQRARAALDLYQKTLPAQEWAEAEARIRAVASEPHGVYALVDYVNFKGEGLEGGERYKGKGWGLLQVLQAMPPGQASAQAFSEACQTVLRERAANAPRDESPFLPGWLKRCRTYAVPL